MPVMYLNDVLFCSIVATADKAVIGHGFILTRDTATVLSGRSTTATDVDQGVLVVLHKDYCYYHY
jgi:hypothetical protein